MSPVFATDYPRWMETLEVKGEDREEPQMGGCQSGGGGERSQLYIACLSRRPGVDPDGVGHHEIDTRHA